MNASNLKQFRSAAELVVSRNREEALKAMAPRLIELAERVVYDEATSGGAKPTIFVFAPGLMLMAFRHASLPGATHVDIWRSASTPSEVLMGEKVFSAWLNLPPQAPGKYMDGKVHVASWKRGWESALVDVRRSPQ